MIGDDPLDLRGQIAFVTGAGQGAGRAIALTLARHNVGAVAVNDFVAERATAVAEEIQALGVRAIAVACDVSDHAQVAKAIATTTEALGPVTILVNNAGNAGPSGPTSAMRQSPVFWETQPTDWDRYMRTNLQGVMNCCHAALPIMVAQRNGRIVTIVSDSGRVGEPRLTAYAAAKAGAAGFMRALAKEAGRFNIRANCVSLSALEPPLDAEAMATFLASDHAKSLLSRYVIRRFGRPEDVANMTLFLSSDAASWITGQTYPVNGGYNFAV